MGLSVITTGMGTDLCYNYGFTTAMLWLYNGVTMLSPFRKIEFQALAKGPVRSCFDL